MGKASHFSRKALRQLKINVLQIDGNLTPKQASDAVRSSEQFNRDLLNAAMVRANDAK